MSTAKSRLRELSRRLRQPGASAPEADAAAAAPAARPAVFTEKVYFQHLQGLLDAGRHDEALRYYVDSLPDLARSKANLKEKFNHLLFPARMIQAGGTTKHGYHKLLRKYRSVLTNLAEVGPLPAGAFVDLGCGAHDPLALACCFFLNGYEPAYAIDLQGPRNEVYSALSMYDVLANVSLFPARWCSPATPAAEFRKRLQLFDLAAFERGDLAGGFARTAGKLSFESCGIVDSSVQAGSVALLASFAVLEHVSDIGKVCAHLFKLLKPGGVAFHFVDLADHRSYRSDGGYTKFSFLTEELPPQSLNRLRAHQVTAAHQDAGFEILKDQRHTAPMSPQERKLLLPQFKAMRTEDLQAVRQQLVVRRPAAERAPRKR
jgi:SAM-dependent methyltransferase